MSWDDVLWRDNPGAWSAVVRFACFIPLFLACFTGRSVYDAVKGLDAVGLYDVIPSGRTFLSGLQMFGTWGIFAFAWDCVTFMGCVLCASWDCVVLGLVDLMISLTFLASAVKQAQFLPRAYSSCGDAVNWNNGTDGRNFFLAANATTFTSYGGPSQLCHKMVETWAIAVSMAVVYGLMGLINIGVGLPDACVNPTASTVAGVFFIVIGGVSLALWKLVLWALDQALAPCRFAFRYTRKALAARSRHRRNQKALQRAQKAAAGKEPANVLAVGKHPVLPHELLLHISRDLHFADLVSANRSSKRLRTTLFGAGGLDPGHLDDLRRATCFAESKGGCELCGMQKCPVCQVPTAAPPSQAFKHMRDCKPHCSRCYYDEYCRGWVKTHHLRPAKHREPCASVFSGQLADYELGVRASFATGAGERKLCRICASLAPAERRRRFEARDEKALARAGEQSPACSVCRKAFSPGAMTWWVCAPCYVECPSHMHPAWAPGPQGRQ